MVAIFSVRLTCPSWSCGNYQPAGTQLWWTGRFAVLMLFPSPQWNFKVWKHYFFPRDFFPAHCWVLPGCAWQMCMEGWALQTICKFCIMWSWANTCDEHLERKILKTIVKRSELHYFPLKNIHMWLWIGWLSHLHRHTHVAALLLFGRKWNRWNVFAATANVAYPRGHCPCRTAVTTARCSGQLGLQ